MGMMQLFIPELERMDSRFSTTAHVTGIEGVAWAGQISIKNNVLSIERAIDESGKVQLVWPTFTRGPLLLSTASLRCNQPPYFLPTELARGSMDRLAMRQADWARWGIQPTDNYRRLLGGAQNFFIDAIVAAENFAKAELAAQASIEYSLAASRQLCQSFSRQLLANRNKQEGKLATMLGCRLPLGPDWTSIIKTIQPMMTTGWVDASWQNVALRSGKKDFARLNAQCDWCRSAGLQVVCGPLINLQPHAIGELFFLLDDFNSVVQAACEYAAKVVRELRGKVDVWFVGHAFNALNDLNLDEDQIMSLTANLLQTVQEIDPTTPCILGIDMPFGEYLGTSERAISPVQFADAIIRSELGVNGLLLEMNFGLWPHGTPMRDTIDFSNLIDLWASLGLPLLISMSGPTTAASIDVGDTPLVTSRYNSINQWAMPNQLGSSTAVKGLVRQSSGSQIFENLTLALAKSAVQGIFWNQPDVISSPALPQAGLLDIHNRPTDLLNGLINLRKRHVA